MDNSNLKAVPAPPQSLEEKIAAMKKALEAFIAQSNRQAAFLEGRISYAEETLASSKEAPPDAD